MTAPAWRDRLAAELADADDEDVAQVADFVLAVVGDLRPRDVGEGLVKAGDVLKLLDIAVRGEGWRLRPEYRQEREAAVRALKTAPAMTRAIRRHASLAGEYGAALLKLLPPLPRRRR